MKYALCVKTEDKNLMHILAADELKSPLYAAYAVIATANDEAAAFAVVADFVQKFCDTGQALKPDAFKKWLENGDCQ